MLALLLFAIILRETRGTAMAKKTRTKAAAKAAKPKASSKKKAAKKKPVAKKAAAKIAVTTKSLKAAAPKKSKPVAEPAAKTKPAGEQPHQSLLERVEKKVAGAFTAVADILTDAEQLHQKLDPGVSREPE
jgi:hypothetical protein